MWLISSGSRARGSNKMAPSLMRANTAGVYRRRRRWAISSTFSVLSSERRRNADGRQVFARQAAAAHLRAFTDKINHKPRIGQNRSQPGPQPLRHAFEFRRGAAQIAQRGNHLHRGFGIAVQAQGGFQSGKRKLIHAQGAGERMSHDAVNDLLASEQ